MTAGNSGTDNSPVTGGTETTQKSDDSAYPAAPVAIAKTEFKMINNATFKLEEQKGNIILFNMWATWCGPCRAEMPELIALQDKYKDKNFKIIGLDADPANDSETEPKIKDFAKNMKLNYDLGWIEDSQMAEFLKISKFSGIPQSFLIDQKGRIRGVFSGGGPRVIGQLKELVAKVVEE